MHTAHDQPNNATRSADYKQPTSGLAAAEHQQQSPTCTSAFAADVISSSFKAVARRLPKNRHDLAEPDRVHALRVATRRAAATIRLLSPSETESPTDAQSAAKTERRFRKARGQLRAIRRSLGTLRDHHVLAELIADKAADAPPACRLGWTFALGVLVGSSNHLHREAFGRLRNLSIGQTRRAARRVSQQLLMLGETSTLSLEQAINQLRRSAELSPSPTLEELHRLRIAIKRARYAAEFVENHAAELGVMPNHASTLRGFVITATETQHRLGELNDRRLVVEHLRSCINAASGRTDDPEDHKHASTNPTKYTSTHKHPPQPQNASTHLLAPAVLASLENALADTEASTESARLRIAATLDTQALIAAAEHALRYTNSANTKNNNDFPSEE